VIEILFTFDIPDVEHPHDGVRLEFPVKRVTYDRDEARDMVDAAMTLGAKSIHIDNDKKR
jgi:hypothetical protein